MIYSPVAQPRFLHYLTVFHHSRRHHPHRRESVVRFRPPEVFILTPRFLAKNYKKK